MKTKLFFTICSLIMFLTYSCEQREAIAPESSADKEAFVETDEFLKCADNSEGTVITVQLYSPSLKENLLGDPELRNVNVYLPRNYFLNRNRRFPVIYYLHGLPASENSLLDPVPFEVLRQVAQLQAPVDFPEEGFTTWVNNLMDEDMEDAIIVMPNASTRYAVSWYINSSVQGNYEDYITKDLISFIDSHFRTIPSANFRAVTGHSAGGYGALSVGIKYPNIFRYVAGLSPGHFPEEFVTTCSQYMLFEDQMWGFTGPSPYNMSEPYKFVTNTIYSLAAAVSPNSENPPYLVDLPFTYDQTGQPIINQEIMTKWNAYSLFALAEINRKKIDKLKIIYFDCGIYDDLLMNLPNIAFHEFLDERGISHQFETYEGTHFSHLYDRLGKVFIDLSNSFPAN
ncbi:hypothetical protein E9993_01415 [Labilibacter sediminis]|nr:hypothetical protein E9993_01415 [Labilibacter sediminis]